MPRSAPRGASWLEDLRGSDPPAPFWLTQGLEQSFDSGPCSSPLPDKPGNHVTTKNCNWPQAQNWEGAPRTPGSLEGIMAWRETESFPVNPLIPMPRAPALLGGTGCLCVHSRHTHTSAQQGPTWLSKWLRPVSPLLIPQNKILRNLSLTMCSCMLSCFSHVQLCDTRSVAHQAPLSMEFSREEYRSGLPFPPPGDLPDPAS